jgi:hypothetical protein
MPAEGRHSLSGVHLADNSLAAMNFAQSGSNLGSVPADSRWGCCRSAAGKVTDCRAEGRSFCYFCGTCCSFLLHSSSQRTDFVLPYLFHNGTLTSFLKRLIFMCFVEACITMCCTDNSYNGNDEENMMPRSGYIPLGQSLPTSNTASRTSGRLRRNRGHCGLGVASSKFYRY